MAMIKIVKGVYGYCGVNMDGHTTKPKTPKDAPFELNDKRAAELVADGIAVYVNDDGDLLIDDNGDVAVGMVPEYSTEMKAAELRDIAKEHMGLTFPVGTTKADMVEQMDAFLEAHTVDDDDDLPELDLDEVVQ